MGLTGVLTVKYVNHVLSSHSTLFTETFWECQTLWKVFTFYTLVSHMA